jgi:Integrase core domain
MSPLTTHLFKFATPAPPEEVWAALTSSEPGGRLPACPLVGLQLGSRGCAGVIAALQAQLDRFRRYYNTVRPHRALGRRSPAQAFTARTKAAPRRPGITLPAHPQPQLPSPTTPKSRPGCLATTVRDVSRHHSGVGGGT